jgi:hypothetical protein
MKTFDLHILARSSISGFQGQGLVQFQAVRKDDGDLVWRSYHSFRQTLASSPIDFTPAAERIIDKHDEILYYMDRYLEPGTPIQGEDLSPLNVDDTSNPQDKDLYKAVIIARL